MEEERSTVMCVGNAQNYTAVITDVDGTIVTGEEIASTFLAFLKAHPELTFTAMTGRGYPGLKKLGVVDAIRCPWVVTESGGRIVTREGMTVTSFPLPEEEVRALIAQVVDHEIDPAYLCFTGEAEDPYTFFLPQGQIIPARYASSAVVHSSLEAFVDAALRKGVSRLNFRLQEGSALPRGGNVAWNKGSGDLLAPGINKARGLRELSRLLGIPLSQMIIAGDDENDRPALELSDPKKFVVGSRLDGATLQSFGDYMSVANPHELGQALSHLFS